MNVRFIFISKKTAQQLTDTEVRPVWINFFCFHQLEYREITEISQKDSSLDILSVLLSLFQFWYLHITFKGSGKKNMLLVSGS